MSTLTIKKGNGNNATDKYALLQSTDEEALNIYNVVFKNAEGSFTTVSNNDTTSKFNVAIMQFNPTEEQSKAISNLITCFKEIERIIDPKRLNFSVTQAMDNEICVNRISEIGISKIIIHEDGVLALSFIAFKGIEKKSTLDFVENETDYEELAYKFFS